MSRAAEAAKEGESPEVETDGKKEKSGKVVSIRKGKENTVFRTDEDHGLPVFKGVSYEEHVSAWIQTQDVVEDLQWKLGAIAYSLQKNYGEGSIRKLAAEVQKSPSTIWMYNQVYTHFAEGKSKRSDTLSFSHHAAALEAGRPKAVQKLLDQAEDDGLTVRQVKAQAKARASAGPRLSELRFTFEQWNPAVESWRSFRKKAVNEFMLFLPQYKAGVEGK